MGLDRSARPNNPPSVPLVLLSQKVAVSAAVESGFVEIHISLGAEMNHRRTDDSESRFAAYVDGLASVIGHKDREGPLRDYCTGLLMPCERKSVEPMAAITAPHRTAAQHQSLLHFVGEGKWSDDKVMAKVREMVLPSLMGFLASPRLYRPPCGL